MRLLGEDDLNDLIEMELLSLADLPVIRQDVGSPPLRADALVHWLNRRQLLTPFQAERVAAGQPRDLRVGNYVLMERVGVGGMGAVFKARHRRMKRIVALKLVKTDSADSGTFLDRLRREAELAARLHHPNIVTAFDADESPNGFFLAMEFVDGHDMATFVRQNGPMPIHEVIDIGIQSAQGLDHAHRHGVIHRDVKPANLLRGHDGVVKVTDMGLARLQHGLAARSHDLTRSGNIAGTVDYMAPEQAVNFKNANILSDVYSLGCSLFYMLVGRAPYLGESLMQILLAHMHRPPPVLTEIRPDAPPILGELLARMMAKNADERPRGMGKVVEALRYCLERVEPVARSSDREPVVTDLSMLTPLPLPHSKPLIARDAEPKRPMPRSALLVEPSRAQSVVINGFLQRLGVAEIQAVGSGAAGLTAAHARCPQAIVCALHLPDMTGLEFALALRRARLCEHCVLITSETEKGIVEDLAQRDGVVWLNKPFDAQQLEQALARIAPMPAPTRRLTEASVLLVEDSAPARRHVQGLLRALGVKELQIATHGKEAAELLELERFDLIVTDYNMPEMDGGQLITHVRQSALHTETPIVMITTETNPETWSAARRGGVAAVLSKQCGVEDLAKPLARYFIVTGDFATPTG